MTERGAQNDIFVNTSRAPPGPRRGYLIGVGEYGVRVCAAPRRPPTVGTGSGSGKTNSGVRQDDTSPARRGRELAPDRGRGRRMGWRL